MPETPSYGQVLQDSLRLCKEARELVAEARRLSALVNRAYSPAARSRLEVEAWEVLLDAYGDAVLLDVARDFPGG